MKKIIITYIIIQLVASLFLTAQDNNLAVYDIKNTATENPQFTLRTFFENMDKSNYHIDVAIKTLHFDEGKDNNKKLTTIRLKKIFDAKGIIINISNVPLDKNFIDSSSMTHIYKISNELPEIYLQKFGNKWLFSQYSVNQISSLYDKLYPFDISELVDRLPEVFRTFVFWMELWQIIGLVLLIVIIYLLYFLIRIVLKHFVLFVLKHLKRGDSANSFAIPISKRLSILIGIILFMFVLPILELPNQLNYVLMFITKILIAVFIVLVAFKLIDALSVIFKFIAQSTQNTVDDVLVPYFRKGLKIVFFIFALFYTLDLFNINITPLLAGVSIGGLAFALAAQDTVKNMLGSITIFMDKPFAIGDWIRIQGADGSVEEIGIRSTRIRTFDNSLITVPNGKLMDMIIDNPGRRKMRRYKCTIQINYNTPKELIYAFSSALRDLAKGNPNISDEDIEISFYEFGEFSLDIRMSVFFKVPNFKTELTVREEFNLQIIELATKLGIDFAFPSQSVYIENSENNSTEK